MLIVKIYEGDKAEDILANLTSNKDLELDDEDITNIERVVRHHTTHWLTIYIHLSSSAKEASPAHSFNSLKTYSHI